MIEILWITFNLACLGLAGYFDWRTRIIPDKIWLIQLLGGLIFFLIWYLDNTSRFLVLIAIVNVLFGILFTLLLIFTGAMAGGDIKGFFTLSISYPVFMTYFEPIFSADPIIPPFFVIIINFFSISIYYLYRTTFYTYITIDTFF